MNSRVADSEQAGERIPVASLEIEHRYVSLHVEDDVYECWVVFASRERALEFQVLLAGDDQNLPHIPGPGTGTWIELPAYVVSDMKRGHGRELLFRNSACGLYDAYVVLAPGPDGLQVTVWTETCDGQRQTRLAGTPIPWGYLQALEETAQTA